MHSFCGKCNRNTCHWTAEDRNGTWNALRAKSIRRLLRRPDDTTNHGYFVRLIFKLMIMIIFDVTSHGRRFMPIYSKNDWRQTSFLIQIMRRASADLVAIDHWFSPRLVRSIPMNSICRRAISITSRDFFGKRSDFPHDLIPNLRAGHEADTRQWTVDTRKLFKFVAKQIRRRTTTTARKWNSRKNRFFHFPFHSLWANN